MDRSNHYEAAFEAYLRRHRYAYVAVNEQRRTVMGAAPIKNLDFIVCDPADDLRLVIDVKGHRFPGGPRHRPRRVWECWAGAEDVSDLLRWADAFGSGTLALLVFVYALAEDVEPAADLGDLWQWRGRRYLLRAVEVAAYRAAMRVRSPKWGTVDLSCAKLRQLARPFHTFAGPQTADPVWAALAD